MGSICRVKIHYLDLESLIKDLDKKVAVYGMVLNGENIYHKNLSPNGVIIIGSESKGISDDLLPYLQEKLSIPSFGGAESLNAAVATAIVCSEFKRHN